MRTGTIKLFLLFAMIVLPAQPAFAAPNRAAHADVTEDQVTFSFPETATFSATLTASSTITSVTLEYGNEQLTCGEVVAKAFPEFTSAKTTPASSMVCANAWSFPYQ